jgi:hypothetical protein
MVNTTPSERLSIALYAALAAATTATVNAQFPDLPPLAWTTECGGAQLVGHATAEHHEPDVRAVLAAWADRLDLTEHPQLGPGTTEHEGRFGIYRVQVWGVTDRDEFDRDPS